MGNKQAGNEVMRGENIKIKQERIDEPNNEKQSNEQDDVTQSPGVVTCNSWTRVISESVCV